MASSKVGSGPPPPVLPAAAASPSPSSAAPSLSSSVECCMCGDHGLARELFRCRSCHFRYQHKYCSDLYPKADTYRSCNWCLREEGTAGAAATATKSSGKLNHHHHSITATPSSTHLISPSSSNKDHHHHHAHQPPSSDRPNGNTQNSHSLSSSTSTADNNSTGSSGAGTATATPVKQLQRGGDYTAHLLAKPLKKLRPVVLERSASEVIVRVKAAEEMGAPPSAGAARRVAGGARHTGGAVRGKIRRYKLLEEVSS